MSHFTLSLLGRFDATLDGQPITAFGTDKARALLAYLAVDSSRPHRRGELAALFWPESPAKKAAHNLSQTLLRLRRALRQDDAPPTAAPQPFLLISSQAVQFNSLSDHRLDVAEFSELIRAQQQHRHDAAGVCSLCVGWLQQAVALYRGDLLAGFSLRDSVPFEEWLLLQQEALHVQAVAALAALASYYERRGELAKVCEYARRLVALEPWHEPAQMQLMAALARCGEEAAALEQYAAYSRTLAQEFDITPSPAAVALYKQIRARQASGQGHGRDQDQVAALQLPGHSERRQITALVCGRRTPSSWSDPEDLRQLAVQCDEVCAPILERYGGQRQQRQGTQCLVYFGYPVAQEDAARRAAHAALALVAPARPTDPAHIGIHTGLMVCDKGQLVGDVPDLARGCQLLSEPNSVWVTADSERLLAGWFDCQPVGSRSLPGLVEDMPVYRLVGESAARNRLAWQAQAQRLTRFAGRQQELQQLVACLDGAHSGQGRVITLCGEAGIGKSRLVWEAARLAEWPFLWLESRCLPYFQNTSLYPLIRLLEQLLEFRPDDEPRARRDKLDHTLRRLSLAQPSTAWLLALLLGLPTDPAAPQTITEDQRLRMRDAFLALLGRWAAEQPLALVIEDLQWADPSTIAWLDASLDALAAAGCLALLTYRPSFKPSWRPRRPLLQLNLGPLSSEQVALMVGDLVGDAAVPDDVHPRLAAQTDGVPLFVEELTRAWLEAGSQTPGSEIPPTLRDALRARLDRVVTARETAGWAAALGREFAYPVLVAVAPYSEERLQVDLAALVQAGLIRPTVPEGQGLYTFRHALIQETAHAALLKTERQTYHRRIAETYAAAFPRIAETRPELLAEHFSLGGLPAQAADYWLQAGERATAQGATTEARAFFEGALASIDAQDHGRRWRALKGREAVFFLAGERTAEQADLAAMLKLAQACNNPMWRAETLQCRLRYLNAVGDYASILSLADEAIAAARAAGSQGLEARALSSKAAAQTRLSDPTAHQTAEEALALAQAAGEDWATAFATGMIALHKAYGGDYARAAQLWACVLALVRQGGDRALESRALSNLGAAYQYLGLFEEAQQYLKAGMALCDLIGDRHSHAYNVVNLGGVKLLSGDLPAARQLFDQALHEATAVDDASLAAGVLWELGALAERAGDYGEAAQRLLEARRTYVQLGMVARVMETDALLAKCALGQGRPEEARHAAGQVWRYLQEHGATAMDEAVSTYLTLANVFQALAPSTQGQGEDPTGRAIIEVGQALLMARAAQISDPLWRRPFLENVPANREMMRRWRAIQEVA